MSTKSKRKQKSRWNIDLLTHSIALEIDTPFQTCVERLSQLQQPPRYAARRIPRSKRQLLLTSDTICRFQIWNWNYSARYSYAYRRKGAMIAKCIGELFEDRQTGKTVIRGHFALECDAGIVIPVALIAALLLLPLPYGAIPYSVLSVFYVIATLMDYTQFQSLIYDVLEAPMRGLSG